MKKGKNLISKIFICCLAVIPLVLTVLFVALALNNPGVDSIKYIIMSVFLGVIGISICIALLYGLVLSKIEEVVLNKGKIISAEICAAELIFATYICPSISSNCIFVEYNNKPSLADTQYRISFKFLNSKGKTIQKTAFLSPYLTKQELSFLVSKGNIKIMNYKNHIAFTQEMLNNELKDIQLNQDIITKNNKLVKIKFGMHSLSISKTKNIINAVKSETKDYKLSIRKKRHIRIDYGAESAQTNYLCCVSYNVKINNEKIDFFKYMSIRDFSRVQQLQNAGKSLPILIKNNQTYIDFDNLPIV